MPLALESLKAEDVVDIHADGRVFVDGEEIPRGDPRWELYVGSVLPVLATASDEDLPVTRRVSRVDHASRTVTFG